MGTQRPFFPQRIKKNSGHDCPSCQKMVFLYMYVSLNVGAYWCLLSLSRLALSWPLDPTVGDDPCSMCLCLFLAAGPRFIQLNFSHFCHSFFYSMTATIIISYCTLNTNIFWQCNNTKINLKNNHVKKTRCKYHILICQLQVKHYGPLEFILKPNSIGYSQRMAKMIQKNSV